MQSLILLNEEGGKHLQQECGFWRLFSTISTAGLPVKIDYVRIIGLQRMYQRVYSECAPSKSILQTFPVSFQSLASIGEV